MGYDRGMALRKRGFFHEETESKPASVTCPKCRHREDDQVRRILRMKDRIVSLRAATHHG